MSPVQAQFVSMLKSFQERHTDRKGKPLSEAKVARMLGVNQPVLNNWLAGRHAPQTRLIINACARLVVADEVLSAL